MRRATISRNRQIFSPFTSDFLLQAAFFSSLLEAAELLLPKVLDHATN